MTFDFSRCRGAWRAGKRELDRNREGLFKRASEFGPEPSFHFIVK
jgi:hypothetical protein